MSVCLTHKAAGYEVASTLIDGRPKNVTIHQLVAIADGANPDRVFSGGEYVTHHKNGIPWDNRHENLEVLTNEEHAKLHASERDYSDYYDHTTDEWWDEEKLREMYHGCGMTMREIADEFGVSQPTIRDRFIEYDIDTRRSGTRRVEIPFERMEEYMSNSDITQRDLADEFDTTPVTVRKRLREAGF